MWKVKLPPVEAGGPYTVTARSTVQGSPVKDVLENVLFGDVWLCSGQSNMEFTVNMVSFTFVKHRVHISTSTTTVKRVSKTDLSTAR